MLKITILTENYVRRRGLLAEHGLSFWIEDGADKVLFDVGQTDVYLHNAQALGIVPGDAHAIVLSHGHYDHGGGLAYFPEDARWPRVFVNPDAFAPKYEKTDNVLSPYKSIGFPWQKEVLDGLDKRLKYNTATMQIGERLFILTDIPQITDFETPAPKLIVQKSGQMIVDDMHDEQILVSQCELGLTVLLGCSHPGVVNCLKYVQALFPGQPVRSIIGGMHLEKANPERLLRTMDFFRQLDVTDIVPLHCTGQNVIWQMKRELGDRVHIRCTGDEICFEK